jgi:hypothetical protein
MNNEQRQILKGREHKSENKEEGEKLKRIEKQRRQIAKALRIEI